MGMPSAFQRDKADFTKMTGSPDFVLSDILHKAAIEVTEEGTKAAAATAAVAIPRMPVFDDVVFDRPFLFMIVDTRTQYVVFMGKFVEPSN